MKYGKFLPENGTIGFVAPSFGCNIEPYRSAFINAQKIWEQQGYGFSFGPNAYEGCGIGISNTPQKCAEEFNDWYAKEDVDVLISCGGGELMCEILPYIESETGVKIRFLVSLRRIPLTINEDNIVSGNYLRENLDVLKVVNKSPYVVGSDFVGEEINDITDLKPAIKELVDYVNDVDPDFTIRIHAGENDSLRDNVSKSIQCVTESLNPGQPMPKVRLGHGLYTEDLSSPKGKKLLRTLKKDNIVLEFQLSSNVRLNNLTNLNLHPIKTYLNAGIKCVQGTDGCGFYGIDTIDEQLALQNLLNLDDKDFKKMRKVEDDDTLENDLFDLIDSMYDNREEGDI